VRVRDTGIDIPPEELPRVFEVFARARGTTEKGFGIGLAIARKLIEQHGGHITAHSDGPGRGSEFTITLPLAKPCV
jgi:two-component system, sensor histidine kinase